MVQQESGRRGEKMDLVRLVALLPIALLVVLMFVVIRFMVFRRVAKKEYKRFSTLFGSSRDKMTQEDLILEMAKSYETSGKKEKAIEYYELYLYKKRVSDPEILFKIGNLYGIEETAKAREFWEKAAKGGHKPAIDLLKSLNDSDDTLSQNT